MPPAPVLDQTQLNQEVRYAVVLYGGVSLAIYIHGVTQELFRLTRATARGRQPGCAVPYADLGGTEKVYRTLSHLLAREDGDLARATASAEADEPIRTRFVIDVLSGTSAGGINGVYLGKALANGQELKDIQELWIEEGDLGRLINDRQSCRDLGIADPEPTEALLNGRRMYRKLLGALDGMDRVTGAPPYVDELDLFITATDIRGVPVPVRLADDVVFERRHRAVFHFRYEAAGGNDFVAVNNPFLAFAARSTSAFPFAFEPMRLSDIDEVLATMAAYRADPDCLAASPRWQPFYEDYRREYDYLRSKGVKALAFPSRSFNDGGCLDNKPFTHATAALLRRHASVPVSRKLLYIEPAPEHPEREGEPDRRPDVAANVLAAVVTLPGYQPIRQDLRQVLRHNAIMQRINDIIRGLELDDWHLERDRGRNQARRLTRQECQERKARWDTLGPREVQDVAGSAPDLLADADPGPNDWDRIDEAWQRLDLADMVDWHGPSYVAYHRLKIAAETDSLAGAVARTLGIDEDGDRFLALCILMRALREDLYAEYRQDGENKPTFNQFLFDFALDYRVRRLSFMRSKIDQLYAGDEQARKVLTDLLMRRNEGAAPPEQARATSDDLASRIKQSGALRKELRRIKLQMNRGSQELDRLLGQPPGEPEEIEALGITFDDLDGILGKKPDRSAVPAPEEPTQGAPLERVLQRAKKYLEHNPEVLQRLKDLAGRVGRARSEAMRAIDRACRRALIWPGPDEANLPAGDVELRQVARRALWHYYFYYDDYDMVLFPILYGSGVGEPAMIDVIRISPEDARGLVDEAVTGRAKLAGAKLFHFGAFLDPVWRWNDMLWGRLDGAERLIASLLPEDRQRPQREALVRAAHCAILRETFEQHQRDLAAHLGRALAARCAGSVPSLAVARALGPAGGPAATARLAAVLGSCLQTDDQLLAYVRDGQEVPPLEPEPMLRALARSTQVIGRMLEHLADQARLDKRSVAWVARLGGIFWGLVEVAAPNSLLNLAWRHWLKVLYVCEMLLALGGAFLYKPVLAFAVGLAVATLALHLLVLALNDFLLGRRLYRWLAWLFLVLPIAALTVIGALEVLHQANPQDRRPLDVLRDSWEKQLGSIVAAAVGGLLGAVVLAVVGWSLFDFLRGRRLFRRRAWVPFLVFAGLAVIGVGELLHAAKVVSWRPVELLVEAGQWLWRSVSFLGG